MLKYSKNYIEDKNMKIVILDGYPATRGEYTYDFLKKYGEVICYPRTPYDLIAERAKEADIILANKIVIDKPIFDKLPKLKLIAMLATGYNSIDIKTAKERGIYVCNIPKYSSPSVAQFTIALLLEITNQVGLHNDSVKQGEWASCPDFCYNKTKQIELMDKTIGLIGYGDIAKQVAIISKAFGMKVLGYRRSGGIDDIAEMVSLDYLIANSDIISLHCPLNAQSEKMINNESIAKMKDNVIIINTARGGLVNEEDLAINLQNGKVLAYGGDVLTKEPPEKDNPLFACPNAFITPHLAWATTEARGRLMEIMEQNISGFVNGKVINNVW